MRVRRAAHVVSFWNDEHLLFHNYETNVCLAAPPLAASLLTFCSRWRSIRALATEFSDYDEPSLRSAVATLVAHGLLVRSDRARDRRAEALATWRAWNPAAGYFHFSTKDVRFVRDRAAIDRRLRRKFAAAAPPPPVKRYPRAPALALPTPSTSGEFAATLLARRTWRRFAARPVTLADISTLLALTWRIQTWRKVPGRGRLPRKTSPSGGSLHPIELYIVARNVAALAPGIYHYAADRHRLERLRRGATRRQLAAYLPSQPWYAGASALFVMTAVFPRTQWKYEFPRAYRVVLAEAGHLCQTFCLTATWLRLAPFCTMALADSRIEKDLGVDGITESVIYVAGVGPKPDMGRLNGGKADRADIEG